MAVPELSLARFRPRPQLVRRGHEGLRPRFPVVDAHNHLAEPFGGGWDQKPLNALLARLDQARVIHYVDLDGGWGEAILQQHLEHFKARVPERFSVFGGVDWSRWPEMGSRFPDWAAQRLRVQRAWGAAGLKVWKTLGLHVRDERGQRVAVDDPRLRPIWQTAAELNWPVVLHVADPVAFFRPLNPANERWEELHAHPDWHVPSPPYPSFVSLWQAMYRLVCREQATTFVLAHVGAYAENLAWVGRLLDECPNAYVDLAARLSELGRQPHTARRFFLRYAERILFGLDVGPEPAAYSRFYRFLETDDEYFAYSPDPVPPQGRWRIHGIFLPAEVLAQVYCRNARQVLGLEGSVSC